MKKSKFWIVLIASLVLVATILIVVGNIPASEKPKEVTFKSLGEVSSFELTDHQGMSHQFSYYNDRQVMVVFVPCNGCPIVLNAVLRLQDLKRKFISQGTQFFMINPNLQDDYTVVKEEAEEFNKPLPILMNEQ